MKLYNSGMVITGITVFVIVATFPLWYDIGETSRPPDLRLDTGAIKQLQDKRCIEATAFMSSNHMKLLAEWRDCVVREGKRLYTSTDGRSFKMSLAGTCLACHENKAQFCDRCHNYAGTKPNCWNCHIDPREM